MGQRVIGHGSNGSTHLDGSRGSWVSSLVSHIGHGSQNVIRYHFWPQCIARLVTFCVSLRRRKMYCGHARLSVYVSVCLSAAVCPHYCADPDVTWGSGRGCPVVVHYWADLQSVHGLRCYGNITQTLDMAT